MSVLLASLLCGPLVGTASAPDAWTKTATVTVTVKPNNQGFNIKQALKRPVFRGRVEDLIGVTVTEVNGQLILTPGSPRPALVVSPEK